ncbi:MAG: nucleotidyltransferase domain-containing protein [Syntrophales bacterium]
MVAVNMQTRIKKKFVVNILAALTDPGKAEHAGALVAAVNNAGGWDGLVRTMTEEGVAFLFFYYLEKQQLAHLVPQEIHVSLAGLYYGNLKRNMIAAAALGKIFQRFNDWQIPFIILKGIALAELAYPGFATRGMSDADILVHKDDVCKVDRCLAELGYAASDSVVEEALQNPPGYLASLDYRKFDGSFPSIHLHWHPVNTSVPAYMFSRNIDLERLWKMAISVRVAGADVRILCPEHQIVYLCEHGLRINHSFDRLILIYDIFYAISTARYLNWDMVVQESGRFRIENLVFLGLATAGHYTPLVVSDSILQALRPAHLTYGERSFLWLQRNNRRLRGGSYPVYLSMNEGIRAKGIFLFRTFFPPSHILLQRSYARGVTFNPSWYLRRLWEGLSHIFFILRHL